MNREWNSKRKDSLLHSSVPALPGSTNPTGCYDMTWCAKRSVSYLSVDSWSNLVQVLHPNSHAERRPSINNTPPRPQHITTQPGIPNHVCVCVCAVGDNWNSVCTHIHTQSPTHTQKSAIKLSQGLSPITNLFHCLSRLPRKHLAHIFLWSSFLTYIFPTQIRTPSHINTWAHSKPPRSHCYHLNMPTAELGLTGTSDSTHCRYFPQPSRTDGVEATCVTHFELILLWFQFLLQHSLPFLGETSCI